MRKLWIDVETTVLDCKTDKIVEIAAVFIENGIKQEFKRYVKHDEYTDNFKEAQKNLDLASGYSQSTNTYINLAQAYATEVQARLANVQPKVSEFNATVNNALNVFTKELEIYRATTQAAIRQAELDQERLMLSANKTTDLSIQNKAQTLSKDISLYKDKLQKLVLSL